MWIRRFLDNLGRHHREPSRDKRFLYNPLRFGLRRILPIRPECPSQYPRPLRLTEKLEHRVKLLEVRFRFLQNHHDRRSPRQVSSLQPPIRLMTNLRCVCRGKPSQTNQRLGLYRSHSNRQRKLLDDLRISLKHYQNLAHIL